MENKNNIFRGEFLPWIIKWGRATNLLGIVLAFGPCLALALMGVWPNWTALAAPAVGVDSVDDSVLPQSGFGGSAAADPVSALGDICRLFEFGGLSLKLMP